MIIITYLENEKTQRLRKDRKKQEYLIDQRRRFETADDVLEREEEKRIIHQEVNLLPAKYRRTIRLRFFFDEDVPGDLSEIESERYAQLAAFANLNEVTLRTHVCRAKNKLKDRLRARGINH